MCRLVVISITWTELYFRLVALSDDLYIFFMQSVQITQCRFRQRLTLTHGDESDDNDEEERQQLTGRDHNLNLRGPFDIDTVY